MYDSELKKILQETCPVRPGQEERAWAAFRDRLNQKGQSPSLWAWLYFPTWRGAAIGLAALCGLAVLVNIFALRDQPLSFASADSQVPGIFATSFYSSSAQAQVVWLNGLDPATDKPTYLDPTTDVSQPAKNPHAPAGDQDSL